MGGYSVDAGNDNHEPDFRNLRVGITGLGALMISSTRSQTHISAIIYFIFCFAS